MIKPDNGTRLFSISRMVYMILNCGPIQKEQYRDWDLRALTGYHDDKHIAPASLKW